MSQSSHGLVPLSLPQYTCAFPDCGLRLHRLTRAGGRPEWIHGRAPAQPHAPEPVFQEELPARLLCDFCTDFDPEWMLGTSNYEVQVEPGAWSRSQGGGWAACQPCKDLIDAGHMAAVTERAVQSILEHRSDLSRTERLVSGLTEAHREFAAHRTGEDEPIPRETLE